MVDFFVDTGNGVKGGAEELPWVGWVAERNGDEGMVSKAEGDEVEDAVVVEVGKCPSSMVL